MNKAIIVFLFFDFLVATSSFGQTSVSLNKLNSKEQTEWMEIIV